MDPMATTWSRSVRRRAPASEQDEAERRELIQKAEELEEAVEALRAERDAAAEEEAALRAELEAERGAAESAASEAMRMIERLQRETAALLLEARQLRRLAESRAGRDRELESRLASLSALARGYLSLLRAHGIDPDAEEDDQQERPPVAGQEFEDTGRVVAMAAAAEEEREQDRVAVDAAAEDLCARLEALEADSAAERREVAALRAERARVVLAREMARRLRQEAAAVAERPPDAAVRAAHKPRFCVLAVCKWFFSMMHVRRKKCSAASSSFLKMQLSFLRERCFLMNPRFTLGLSTAALLGLLLKLDRPSPAVAAYHRRRPP